MTVGLMTLHGAPTPPDFHLECDGSEVDRVTFGDLFAVIGTDWGVGDGSTSFNLPDVRGQFIRGWDNGAGRDPARVFATGQNDELASHSHQYGWNANCLTGTNRQETNASNSTTIFNNTGGSETRPRNMAVLPVIRFI